MKTQLLQALREAGIASHFGEVDRDVYIELVIKKGESLHDRIGTFEYIGWYLEDDCKHKFDECNEEES